jgi:NADPH-dependent curcumin reductase CurA
MAPTHYTTVVLNERPTTTINENTFKIDQVPFDLKPGSKQVVVQVTYLSLDPAMRGWLNDTDRGYLPPIKLGEVMRAYGLGVVIEAAQDSSLQVGDTITGRFGEYELSPLVPSLI